MQCCQHDFTSTATAMYCGWSSVPIPRPTADQVRIKVHACAPELAGRRHTPRTTVWCCTAAIDHWR